MSPLNHDTYMADGFSGPIAHDRDIALAWYALTREVHPRIHVYLYDGDREVDVTGDFADELEAEREGVDA